MLGLTAGASHAQSLASKRVEIPVPTNGENLFTIPVRSDGVLLLVQTSKTTYRLSRLDTNLERVWSIDGTISPDLDYATYSYDGKDVYLLFNKYRSTLYQVVKVYVGPGFTEKFDIYSVDKLEVTQFKAHRDAVYIAGVTREQPVLLYTNLQNRTSKMLPSAVKGSSDIQAIEIDTLTGRVHVSYSVKKGKNYSLVVKSFDQDGRQESQIIVEPEEDYALLNGKISTVSDSSQLMVGTYGFRNMQSATRGTVSQGLYISRVTEDEVLPTRYYSFTDFRNFFKFLSPKDQEKKERQIQRKKEQGGDLKLNYHLLVHDLIQQNGQLIMVAEAFQPTFRYQNSPWGFGSPFGFGNGLWNPYGWGWGLWSLNPWYFGNRGMWGGNSQQQFDGWQYTHAVVAGFDSKGNLLWDNSFEIDNVKSMTLKEKVKVSVQNGQVTLFYSDKGNIRSKVVQGNRVVENTAEQLLLARQSGDKLRRSTSDDLEYWFDNYFLAWGYQRIQNEAEGRRNVFYLNKIAF